MLVSIQVYSLYHLRLQFLFIEVIQIKIIAALCAMIKRFYISFYSILLNYSFINLPSSAYIKIIYGHNFPHPLLCYKWIFPFHTRQSFFVQFDILSADHQMLQYLTNSRGFIHLLNLLIELLFYQLVPILFECNYFQGDIGHNPMLLLIQGLLLISPKGFLLSKTSRKQHVQLHDKQPFFLCSGLLSSFFHSQQ